MVPSAQRGYKRKALSAPAKQQQDPGRHLISDLEQTPHAAREAQPELGALKGFDEQKVPNY